MAQKPPSTIDELYGFYPEEGFRCPRGCGECCSSDFPVSKPEVERIAQWIVDNVGFDRLQDQYRLYDSQPGKCPFLMACKKCLIYPVRPFVCRQFGHVEELKGVPLGVRRRINQKCPRGLPFTAFKISDIRAVYNKWYDLAMKGCISVREFRNAVVADKMGFKGVLK